MERAIAGAHADIALDDDRRSAVPRRWRGGRSARPAPGGAWSGFADPLLAEVGFAIWRELERPTTAGKLYAETAAELLAVHLLRHHAGTRLGEEEPAGRLTPPQTARVMAFVRDQLNEDVSLGALAAEAGISPYHFARRFRRTTGESPHQFVVGQRVERARHLLEATDRPLADIAIEAGFASQSHLTDSFRRRVGTTPGRYRRARS